MIRALHHAAFEAEAEGLRLDRLRSNGRTVVSLVAEPTPGGTDDAQDRSGIGAMFHRGAHCMKKVRSGNA